jgi:hypothetical protein
MWEWEPMPRKGVTGHDEWVITEALATALIALEQLPPQHQPRTHMDDIRRLLAAGCEPETLALAGSLVGKKPGTRGLRLRILQTLLRIPLAALAPLVKRGFL